MKLIATLTTLPSRIVYLEPVLRSMLDQSMPPDEIHLQLPKHCLKENCGYTLPDFIHNYPQVKVFEHEQDFGPSTKWLPALAHLQGEEAMLLIMDDDCHYTSAMVANLYGFFQKDRSQVYCSTGGVLQGQTIRQFNVHEELQNNALTVVRNNKSPIVVDTVQGFSLILFDPNLVPGKLIELLQGAALAQLADDIVLSAVFEKVGVKRVQIAPYQVPQPLDQAEINPIHGEGRLTKMSMSAFQWAQQTLSVWDAYEFEIDRKEPFLQRIKKPFSVFKNVARKSKQWLFNQSVYKHYAIIVYQNALARVFSSQIENKYLFVLGATHGGTTVLTELLSRSAHVSSNNYLHTREGQLLPTVIDHMYAHGRQWEEDLEIDWNFIMKEWRKYWDIRKVILLEKSPPNLLRATAIAAVFEPAYFLVFVRNPYAHCETFIRKNGFTPKQTAEFVIRTLKAQHQNLKELDRVLLLHYETLVKDPGAFKKQLTGFLEELIDIDTGGVFYAHNYYDQPHALKNFNQEKIDRLSSSAISEINEVFAKNKDLLHYFGYSLKS